MSLKRRYRHLIWLGIAALGVAACSSNGNPATTAASSTSDGSVTTTTAAVATTAAPPPPSTTTTQPPAPIGTTFVQQAENEDAWSIEIAYPHLVHPNAEVMASVNQQLDEAIQELVAALKAAAADSTEDQKWTLILQAAPELVNEGIFSVSGVSFEFDGASETSVNRRLGWIFDLRDGSLVSAADLLTGGNLVPLADAARSHLVADIFGDAEAITSPEGLQPELGNFDGVWLTETGIGVGFDQYQIAGEEAGTPSVLIPFDELSDSLNTTGILAALGSDGTLPGA